MKWCPFILSTLALLPSLPAQSPATPPAKLTELTTQFQATYDREVTADHAQSLLDLDSKYAAAVKRAFDTATATATAAATAAAKLEEALALRKELQRLTAKEGKRVCRRSEQS